MLVENSITSLDEKYVSKHKIVKQLHNINAPIKEFVFITPDTI